MKFNDLKISTRLTLGFGLMALLIGLMGTLSVVLASRADKAFHSIIDDRFPKVLHLHVAKEDVTGVELALTQMLLDTCLLYTSPSPRDRQKSRMPSSA